MSTQTASADRRYLYREDDGTLWITDIKPSKQDHKRFELAGVIGKGPPEVLCSGLSSQAMQRRFSRFRHSIYIYASRFGVNAQLVRAVIQAESCFDELAISSAGAQGLMQLMPRTAKALGVKNSFDADQNLRGGIKYLSQLLKRYDHDLQRALAAYNAGPAAVEKYGGIPPYRETQRYVARVLEYYDHFRNHPG